MRFFRRLKIHSIVFVSIAIGQKAWAQSSLQKFDGYGGLLAGTALNIQKDIFPGTFLGLEVGARRHFHFGKGNYFTVGLGLRNMTYYTEGYFLKQNGDDFFVRTADNVKVNRLEFSPVSIITGYRRAVGSKAMVGIDVQSTYLATINRMFKVGSDTQNETFNLQERIYFGLSTVLNLPVGKCSSWRYELFSDFSLTSYSSARNFRPFSFGVRIARGFGK